MYILVIVVKYITKIERRKEMTVFTKYLLRSIGEKKGRTLLLLISIAISVALLVASMGAIKALLGTFSKQVKGNFGDFNIAISASKSSSTPLFDAALIKDTNLKNHAKFISMGGFLTSDNDKGVNLIGCTLQDIDSFNTMKYIKKENLEPFEGNKALISQRTSDNLKLSVGDELKITILGKEYIYKIAGILSNNTLFFDDNDKAFSIVTPEENLFSIYGEKNKYTSYYGVYEGNDIKTWIKDFNKQYKENNIQASELFDEKAIEDQLSTIKMPLYFMLTIVLLMTTFIIYSSFRLIITERLPVIGTFLSQGATKGGIITILLRESLIYGILGGILGDALGGGLTYLIAYFANPLKEYGVSPTPTYYPPYFIIGFIFAIILSLGSSLIPILRTRKLPIKDVILNTISTSANISLKGFVSGMILLIISIIIHFTGEKIHYVLSVPGLFLAFIGVMLILPKLVDVTVYPLVRTFRNISGLSMVSFNNVRTSKVLINNMRLIAVSVISILMIGSLKTSISSAVDGAYSAMEYDIQISSFSNNKQLVDDLIRNFDDSKNIVTNTHIISTLNKDDAKMLFVSAIDPEKYKTFENYVHFDNKEKQLNELSDNEDGIIVSKQISNRYKIKQGDTITLTTDGKDSTLKVLSIFDAKLMNSGNYNLISTKTALKYFNIKYPDSYFMSVKNSPDEAKKALDTKLKGLGVSISTKAEANKINDENNKMFINVLAFFSYATMIIGSFGILSNVSISFIQRKRELSVMSSVGLTKGGRGFMLLLEGIFQGLFGGFLALIAGYGIIILFKDIFRFLLMDFDLVYPYKESLFILTAATAIMIIASLSSIFRSKKLQIINELKYE